MTLVPRQGGGFIMSTDIGEMEGCNPELIKGLDRCPGGVRLIVEQLATEVPRTGASRYCRRRLRWIVVPGTNGGIV